MAKGPQIHHPQFKIEALDFEALKRFPISVLDNSALLYGRMDVIYSTVKGVTTITI